MVDELTSPTVSCVYDDGHTRHVLDASGIYRDIQRTPWVFFEWLTAPEEVPAFTPGSVLVEFRHPAPSYSTRTDEERKRVGFEVGAAFCVFLQGAVVGWDIVHRDEVVNGERRDEIRVHDLLADRSIPSFLAALGLTDAGVRRLCREDLVFFAVSQHEEQGAASGWTTAEFLNSGVARLPYSSTLVSKIVEDLTKEKKLKARYGHATSTAWLMPELFEAELDRTHEKIEAWLQRLREYGKQNSWIPADGETSDMATASPKDPQCVFVVHGRNEAARKALFDFLRAIGLHPLEWSEAIQLTGKATPYVGEILDAAFDAASAIVVLLTPDDEARLCDQFIIDTDDEFERNLTPQARPNVLFEAGMAMGRDPDRTILIEVGKLRPFSDVAGRHMIRMDNSTERRQNLAARLATAGCPVNLNGTDWHSAGDFSEV